MKQTTRSFITLFGNANDDNAQISSIEIPLIQRDYAQGRQGEGVERIRKDFLDALYGAVMPGGEAISLDFVYGDVVDQTLYPLDGQQRLTTLFLLHWYLCWRAEASLATQAWRKFSYATRASARQFCEALASHQPPSGEIGLRGWIVDQAWYFHGWQHDASISAMLVMLEALEQRFAMVSVADHHAAWQRLNDPLNPAISFHLLPIKANKLTHDLYIKMNSRGKPLTAFENFKAHFEAVLKAAHPQKVEYFALSVDTRWADILWSYRDFDHLIDDEFMRYFRFICDLCSWHEGSQSDDKISIDTLAEKLFGPGNPNAKQHLEFLFNAFDVWEALDIRGEFSTLFTTESGQSTSALLLFNPLRQETGLGRIDLFGGCCRYYGKSEWSQSHSLLLYAVLLHRIHATQDFPYQLRVVRNLIESSGGGEMRIQNMPNLLEDVRHIVVDNNLEGVATFNQKQLVNESDKAALLASHPSLRGTLYQLEDHRLLRGSLTVFHLDPTLSPDVFSQRAQAYHTLFDTRDCWPELTGALLALGDYSRKTGRWGGYKFYDLGSSDNDTAWRELLMGRTDPNLTLPLTNLLDQVAENHHDLTILKTIQKDFIDQCLLSEHLDWRYYLVKYPTMRDGSSGRYAVNASGYGICMLDYTVMRSNYRDPYLSLLSSAGGLGTADQFVWFSGYETEPRRMYLYNSTVTIESVGNGWQLADIPIDPAKRARFDEIFSRHGVNSDYLCAVPQKDGRDIVDRIDLGAALVRELREACSQN